MRETWPYRDSVRAETRRQRATLFNLNQKNSWEVTQTLCHSDHGSDHESAESFDLRVTNKFLCVDEFINMDLRIKRINCISF